MGEKPTAIEDEEPGDSRVSPSNLNLSKANINREAVPGGGAAGEPAGIAVSDPGVPGDKGGTKPSK